MGRQFLITALCSLVLFSSRLASISSGWPALEREFQSAVQIWTIDNEKPKFLCSGVAIAPDTVLTSASCVQSQYQGAKEPTLFISTGHQIDFKVPLAQAIQNVSAIAKKGVRDPQSDLMIVFLKQPLKVEPALLLAPHEIFQIRLLGQVSLAGYGFRDVLSEKSWWNGFWGSEAANVPGERIIAKSRILQLMEKELEFGSSKDEGLACAGDEGAPLYAHIDTPFRNSERVIGIVMHTEGLSWCEKPTKILRLDAFRDFINEEMVRKCQNGTRSWCETDGLLLPGHNEEMIREQTQPSIEIVEHQPEPTETKDEAQQVPSEPPPHILTPDPLPAQVANLPQAEKPSKRRLSATAEGAGCSCQQVFTAR